LLLALSGFLTLAAPASNALAEYGIAPGGFTVETLDTEGNPQNIAGSHPDRLRINFALDLDGTTARDLEFELPPGLGGNPAAVPQCPRSVYESEEECPPESQVGVFEVRSGDVTAELPMFQLEPLPGQLIAFGSKPSLDLPLDTELRAGDFGLTLKANDLPQESVSEGHFELWGVPADHQIGTAIPRRALLTTPTSCAPMTFTFRTRSWLEGAPWLSAVADTGGPLSGCEGLSFAPQLGIQLSNPVADSPTGLRMDLRTPEEAEGSERAGAQMKNVTVELPKGVGVSPAGADGLVACTDAQLGLGSNTEAQCPQSAKLGTAEFSSPSLGPPLGGTIYLGQEQPGQRFRIFLVAQGSGATIKSVSTLRVNPVTGRLTTVLENLPQVSIQRISLIFDGGPRALLASPLSCGPATAVGRFAPYGGGPTVVSTATVAVEPRGGGPCTGPAPFAPNLTIESSSHRAGRPTTISTMLRRQPGEQLPKKFSATLPAGMSTRLGAIQVCSAAAAEAEACPLASKVGDVLAEVGSGANPAVLRGNVYVTDSYRRAPFGLLIEFRARIGSFDLGATTTRGTAELDRKSGRFTVSIDDLPEEVEGVPIRFQAIEMKMNKPGFIRNPTSCSPKSAVATLESHSGATATATSPLQLHGCDRLGFKPGIRMAFLGRGELHKHGSPGLRLRVHLRRGDTALRSMKLSMPPALKFAIGGLGAICPRLDATEGACPAGSRVGTARARSSLMSKPLSGSIFLAQPSDNGPPDMWVSLAVMGVQVAFKGETFARDGRFFTRLSDLPDMPLSALTMRLGGGENRIFSLAVSPCRQGKQRRFVATVDAEGQDGDRRTFHSRIGTKAPCAGSPRSPARGPASAQADAR